MIIPIYISGVAGMFRIARSNPIDIEVDGLSLGTVCGDRGNDPAERFGGFG